MGRRVVVRILGIASTAKGFAYAVTEGPHRLVLWGMSRGRGGKITTALDRLMKKSRPLFVAFDKLAVEKKQTRGRLFSVFLERSYRTHNIMMIPAEARKAVDNGRQKIGNWDIAKTLTNTFQELRYTLPPKRRPWETENERLGIFMALATSVAAWKGFQRATSLS
jgi:hypothetical protein